MKIGFVSRYFPFNIDTCVHGIYKRMFMFIDAIKDFGQLEMLFFVDPDLPDTNEYKYQMENKLGEYWDTKIRLHLCRMSYCNSQNSYFDHFLKPAMSIKNQRLYSQTCEKKHVSALSMILNKELDILFIHRLHCMIPLILSKKNHPNVYLDMDDIEHVALSRFVKQPPIYFTKILYYLWIPIIALWERRAIQIAQKTFVCSDVDRRYLEKLWRIKTVVTIPNAIEIYNNQELKDDCKMLFIGNFTYLPNIIAADFLIKKIWPKVISKVPEARLIIAGPKCENIESFIQKPHGVQFFGFVNNLEKLYSGINVVCCPILAGGGTRIKIIEAASFGKPIISTKIGAEGLNLLDGIEILIRDEPQSFADACILLLRNIEIGMKMGKAARSKVISQYERKSTLERIREQIISSNLQ